MSASQITSLRVGPVEGFAPQIGHIVSMLEFARRTTVGTVRGMTTEQLDHLQDERSNSIGALLGHVAAVEAFFAELAFHDRRMAAEELGEWAAGLTLGETARRELRDRPLEEYLNRLETVRAATLQEFGSRDDEWLYSEMPLFGGKPTSRYFIWFHVLEDEIHHRGQMSWLRRRLPGEAT